MPGLPEAGRTALPGRGRRGWPLSSGIQGCFSGALRTWWTSFLVKMDVIASPFGRGVTAGDGEGKLGAKELPYSDKQTLCQRDVIAVSVLFVSGLASQALRAKAGLRLPASASALGADLASCWPRPQQRLPVSAAGGGRRCCSYRGEALAYRKTLPLRQRLPR